MLMVTTLAAVVLLVGHLFHHETAGQSYAEEYHAVDDDASYIEPPGEPLFPASKPLVIWSSNFHPAPVHDLKTLLQPLGVRFIDKDVSTKYCQHFNTCSTGSNVRVINSHNFLALKDYKVDMVDCRGVARNLICVGINCTISNLSWVKETKQPHKKFKVD